MKLYVIGAAIVMVGGTAFAAGPDDHTHSEETLPVGQPGTAPEVDRTIEVRMFETGGRMGFEPAELEIEQGATIRFEVTNTGDLDHEIVFGTREANLEHRAEMTEMPGMQHSDPNALHLAPGKSGQIVWTFEKAGTFQFACLIPGHMEAGMHGPITVQ